MDLNNFIEYYFKAKDGLNLYGRGYRAEPYRPDRVAVIAHGIGEHSGRYGPIVEPLLQEGISVYACDFRGSGRSEGLRGHARGIGELVSDLSDFLEYLDRTENVHRPALIGHSMGALVSLAFCQRRDAMQRILCLVTSGPALKVNATLSMKIKKMLGKLIRSVAPTFRMKTGIKSRILSHDPSVQESYAKDDLVHPMVSASLGVDLLEAGGRILKHGDKIELPVLLLHGGSDQIADPQGSRMMMDRVRSRIKELKIYDGLYHEIFNEIPEKRARVLSDAVGWISTQFDRNI